MALGFQWPYSGSFEKYMEKLRANSTFGNSTFGNSTLRRKSIHARDDGSPDEPYWLNDLLKTKDDKVRLDSIVWPFCESNATSDANLGGVPTRVRSLPQRQGLWREGRWQNR